MFQEMKNLLQPLGPLGPLYDLLYWPVVYPLKLLYFFGPPLLGYGFWYGRAEEDICYELTNSRPALAPLLKQHPEICAELVDDAFRNFIIATFTIVYFVSLTCLLRGCSILCWHSMPCQRTTKHCESSTPNDHASASDD
jgi:hypothetical protein